MDKLTSTYYNDTCYILFNILISLLLSIFYRYHVKLRIFSDNVYIFRKYRHCQKFYGGRRTLIYINKKQKETYICPCLVPADMDFFVLLQVVNMAFLTDTLNHIYKSYNILLE
jgi:hypothetical protein